jgi:aspartate 1-decarboxylase
MEIEICRAKIHRARLTGCELNYEGSITIDQNYLDEVGILPYEKVLIVNNNNGERLETYVIAGDRGKGDFCINGAAARKACPGDVVIIVAFGRMHLDKAKGFEPKVIMLDEKNNIVMRKQGIEPNNLVTN